MDLSKIISRLKKSRLKRKWNNAGVTLVEMLVTFLLLGIFMVTATRVISYTIGIYYTARGTSYGFEVSNMLTNKIVGMLENASMDNTFEIVASDGTIETENCPVIITGTEDADKNRLDQIKFVDATGSVVTISANSVTGVSGTTEHYLVIHYDETVNYKNNVPGEEPKGYAATDWKFDNKAYMGYFIKSLKFTETTDEYPNNVLQMDMTLHSPKYGDFNSTYYIKCFNVEKIIPR